MTDGVVVTGIGLVSALGPSLATTWSRLLAGESAIALRQPFVELPPWPLAMVGKHPADLKQLTHHIVDAVLADAGLQPPLEDCGVILGSSRSLQGMWEQLAYRYRESPQSPLPGWLEALPHTPALYAAQKLGSTGPVAAPMAACATGLWAIAQGYEWIQAGQCQRVLVGAVETPITPLTLAGFDQMGALATNGCFPFDHRREGLVLGEGGAVFMLETAHSAEARQQPHYGYILGLGRTADGHHISAPDPGQTSSLRAIQASLRQAGISAAAIDYIHAHGTSTRLNDENEARLIQSIFPPSVRVSSTKGATGHTLGASGALGLAFCLMTLRHQVAPPCTGLSSPEFPLNFVRHVAPEYESSVAFGRALCLGFGFGGQNVSVVVGQAGKNINCPEDNPVDSPQDMLN